MDVETAFHPPEVDADDGDLPSARLSASLIHIDDAHYDAAVQLFGAEANDPERFAAALLRAALALGTLLGSDYQWAVTQRFAAYDGTAQPGRP